MNISDMHKITAIEMMSTYENGKYKRLIQILGRKLPPLYIKFGNNLFDMDIKINTHTKEVADVRKMLYIIGDLFYDDYPYILEEILQYVDPDYSSSCTPEKIYIVDALTEILDITRFNTVLDIGASGGEFLENIITNELAKHGIAVDIVNPDKWFFPKISLNSQIFPRIEYRQCDGLTRNFTLPQHSLVTSFYLNCDPTENFRNVVDIAINNNAPLIMCYREIDSVINYAQECGMEQIDAGDNLTAVFI